ncbi:hypothetical protein [Pseudomonas sp. OV226]|uniref:hypothetical protein n=1 Tax=Pseudomonas sp. OV226 TaxID=2135588 RepID=UPI000D791434|nr:hypothetical protein [Pseudomonas sp. OV226]PWK27265.1 hypothetical protein C7534_1451 [Pseudomonas sp. OV226]
MSKTLVETLDSMAAAHASKSQTARLRAIFVHIENALRSGVSRQAVLDALHQDGFTLSMQSFEKALYRIRQKTKLPIAPPPIIKTVLTTTTKPSAFAHIADLNPRKPGEYNPVPDEDRIYGRKPENTTKAQIDFKKLRDDTMKNTDWEALSNGD